MTITREQVADLRDGDEVELTGDDWHGTVATGKLWTGPSGDLNLGAMWVVRQYNGRPFDGERRSLKVIKRAPLPVYENHPRTAPERDDVIRDGNGRLWVGGHLSFGGGFAWWSNPQGQGTPGGGPYWKTEPVKPWTLLVDGTTKSAVN